MIQSRDLQFRGFDLNKTGESFVIDTEGTTGEVDIQFVLTTGSWSTAVVKIARATNSTRPDDSNDRAAEVTGVTDTQHTEVGIPIDGARSLVVYVATPQGSAARCNIFASVKQEV